MGSESPSLARLGAMNRMASRGNWHYENIKISLLLIESIIHMYVHVPIFPFQSFSSSASICLYVIICTRELEALEAL